MAFDSSAIRPRIGDLPEIDDLEDRVSDLENNIPAGIQSALDAKPDSADVDFISVVSQAAYDALSPPDTRTLYVVVA